MVAAFSAGGKSGVIGGKREEEDGLLGTLERATKKKEVSAKGQGGKKVVDEKKGQCSGVAGAGRGQLEKEGIRTKRRRRIGWGRAGGVQVVVEKAGRKGVEIIKAPKFWRTKKKKKSKGGTGENAKRRRKLTS